MGGGREGFIGDQVATVFVSYVWNLTHKCISMMDGKVKNLFQLFPSLYMFFLVGIIFVNGLMIYLLDDKKTAKILSKIHPSFGMV